MKLVYWGVMRADGYVWEVDDAVLAFQRERTLRGAGEWEARAVVSLDRLNWRTVAVSSSARPDPVPPSRPRTVGVADRLGRGGGWWARVLARWGRNRSPFGKSK